MSKNSLSRSFTSTRSVLTNVNERPDLESIRVLVISVNQYIHESITNAETWKVLKLRCISRLNAQKQEFFEFADHSVISNLFWGIGNIEAAMQAKRQEEKTCGLRSSEGMLQVPALLDEDGVTAGIPNRYLVSCSYFYLSVVKKLQRDEWQAATYFLQALLVSPRLIRTEFAQELCERLFSSCTGCEIQEMGERRCLVSTFPEENYEDNVSESMRLMAARYKHCLMYYQVMFYGETPQWQCGSGHISSPDYEHYFFDEGSTSNSKSKERRCSLPTYCSYEKLHPLDPGENETGGKRGNAKASGDILGLQDYSKAYKHLEDIPKLQIHYAELKRNPSVKSLQDMLQESRSDTPTSVGSTFNDGDWEAYMEDTKSSITRTSADDLQPETSNQTLHTLSSTSGREYRDKIFPQAYKYSLQEEGNEETILEIGDEKLDTRWNCHVEDNITQKTLEPHHLQLFQDIACTSQHAQMKNQVSATRIMLNLRSPEKDSKRELLRVLEKVSEEFGNFVQDYAVEVPTIYEMLNNKTEVKYGMLKDAILDQLLTAISTSKKETVIRASVTVLIAIVSVKKSVLDDIKNKGLQLSHLASALKRNVHEAATLIYLIKPSPSEIKTLELLPALVEVVCTSTSYKGRLASLVLTPPAASVIIIEVLVTAFDCATNNMHLAAINSPRVLRGLLDVTRSNDLEQFISLTTILVKCMQFDGQCRKHISQFTPMAPFIRLLQSDDKRAKCIALEFFHEILQIPRSSAIALLQQIRKKGSKTMHTLLLCVRQLQSGYHLLAANLLIQLDIMEDSTGKSLFREEAMQVLLEAVASEESSTMQLLSAFILSNIGGTYAWTGEPYTIAWLVKKAGLTSMYHRNMIKHFDWLDHSLQDAAIDSWCSKIARSMIDMGESLFCALEKGLRSTIKRVSRDSLTAVAWLGCEITKSPQSIRYSACDILLGGIEQYLHPGSELDERLVACLCIYNYASGKGMQKLIHLSEGERESLRRFSNVTWMAEELHKVADYYLPHKSRISCVHTQILEISNKCSGAVTALIYYKGLLFSGYYNGSIKVWDITRQSTTLIWDMKEHKRAVTCFSVFEIGESLLSGSADKTIKVWQMVQRKLECIEVIATKEPIKKLETSGQLIFVITRSHRLKVFDSSRTVKDICKRKRVKCMRLVCGRIYAGCMDSSIQELAMTNNREREIKAPTKRWRIQNKPINSIVVYKDWIYSASSFVEGSNIKDWRRHHDPQMSIVPDKGANILAMGVVEDFIYLNCSSSTSTLQIWLRKTQQKVGRISAGSKITTLLTANDIVICGTETGQIKGWIPL
ncbi:WD40 domain-containing protein [Cephalotus follicularis]|uniref:WD40 domain-containing protein n=1 Tax=Cephalotus follicularis TaxID=3775 RepID=A0A1Q3C4C2_CEPFO|nr:WD40 domain-containing protein [Cephalotus follicularis]